MQLAADDKQTGLRLNGYDSESLTIDGRRHPFGLILTPQRLTAPWGSSDPDWPDQASVAQLVAIEPEVVLIALHPQSARPPLERIAPLIDRQIGCEMMPVGAAIRTYSLLSGDGRRVALAIPPLPGP